MILSPTRLLRHRRSPATVLPERRSEETDPFRHSASLEAVPVESSDHPVAADFLLARRSGRPVAVYYHGGSTPGALRIFIPETLFRLRPGGPIYARGFCHLRHDVRTLRVDRARPA